MVRIKSLTTKKKRVNAIKKVMISLIITICTKKNINRRWWVRPWLKKTQGNLSLIKESFKLTDPEQFRKFLRMDESTFNFLLCRVGPIITKQDTFMRLSISAKDKLLITLRFLATGESYRSLMYSFRVSESTISLFVPKVCRAIYDTLREDYLKVPTVTADWLNIAQDFENRWNIPNTIGALDGKHIVFNAPKSAGSVYFNYKGTHSIVLLALVDANYMFRYIDVGTNGRVSDGGVFANSSLYRALFNANNPLNIPENKSLPGRNLEIPHVVVADAAFPLSTRILKPFPIRNMTTEQRIFNYRVSRARRVVENAFGILANRFRILLNTINLSPEKVQVITLACCVLHNFLRKEMKETYNEQQSENMVFQNGLSHQGGNRYSTQVRAIRDEFMLYYNNEGCVPWQMDK
nr:protein ALP1-like [Onthophagus taurus]